VRSRFLFGRAVLIGALALIAPAVSQAQLVPVTSPPKDSTKKEGLFTVSDALLFGGFLVGAAVARPLDTQIATKIREPSAQLNHVASTAARSFNFYGSPGVAIAGVAMYGVGRIGHLDRLADLGLHSTEAITLSAGITYLIKGLAGRERPSSAGVNEPDDFHFGAGFTHATFSSFPSGHATAAFAAATVVTVETHQWWPKSTWFVAPIMFGTATMVGMARLYSNAHWASDVVVGAGIGTLTGLKVFRYNHVTHKHTRLNTWLLRATPTVAPDPDGHGAMLAWSFPAPR
jgi:membrane-associated phospholipid phosphatase